MKKDQRISAYCHRFTYQTCPRDDRAQKLHEIRDGDAFSMLLPLLIQQGFVYGELLLNFADNPQEIDLSFLSPHDLLVLTTRPPLSDDDHEDRKRVEKSRTSLEKEVLKVLRRYFYICARSHIMLQPCLASKLLELYRDRARAKFRQNSCASYTERGSGIAGSWQSVYPDQGVTAAYFVYTRETWPGGPGILASFGMAGTETLLWNRLLSRKPELSRLLNSPVFAIAELEVPDVPSKATDMRFADDMRWNIVMEVPLTPEVERELDANRLRSIAESSEDAGERASSRA